MADLEPYIPYKGNKFQIVENIYNSIIASCPEKIQGFVDPFMGGGSFTYFVAARKYPVISNDLDTSVVELHKACRYSPQEVDKWARIPYTKAGFKAELNNETAKGALIRSMWSFSNDGRTYLTSTENEQKKIEQFLAGGGEPLTRYKHIEDIILLWFRKNMNITFVNGTYEKLPVPEGWVVYCDPPYANTQGYRAGEFDHEAFYNWCLEQPGYVYIRSIQCQKNLLWLTSTSNG